MSGFGSAAFGSTNPFGTPAAPNNQPTQQQQFGAPSQGFGSAQTSGSGFASGGFGTSPAMSGFGGGFGTQQQQPTMGNVNSTPLGGGGSASSSGFGNPQGGGGTQFGTVSNTPVFGSSSNVSSGFGPLQAANNVGGFGGVATQTPFGSASATSAASTPFGQSTTTVFPPSAPPSSSFGGSSSSNTPFGGMQTGPTPFGATQTSTTTAPSSSSGISFGVSSTSVVAPIPPPIGQQQQTSFGGPTSSGTSPAFGTTSSVPFGMSSSTAPPPLFGRSKSSFFGTAAPSSTTTISGFGGGFQQQSSDDNDDMMDGGGGDNGGRGTTTSWTSGGGTTSPIPTTIDLQDSSMVSSPTMPAAASSSGSSSRNDELAQLKAKRAEILRKKKKKLEELKRRKEQAAAVSSSSSTLNARAPSFVPTNKGTSGRTESAGGERDIASSSSSSLADRNAARFAKPDTDDALLPEELRNHRGDIVSGYKEGGSRGETQDIDNAVSLVGTCPYMCPDDELIRRQREGDIQLLETPLPGTIHPKDWTLRNTAVKRFRRSAADYKLDVPAWVRPPDVLEKVCGYLEEWVMERDRQGPDSRFPQSESPPSLDVYQFIWDRTRMVRKDFTLQNYVGTGGNCDARAVRCHERIARWHAMCEHQLSHIPEFVNAQSQQNMQEFGQAMKTLNLYYDDSLRRATVEVPDEEGNETRTDLSGTTHGCTSQVVMGKNPVDFNGTPLKNDTSSIDVSKRLIGPQAVNRPSHGTAEPEMRGLYIITTMNNDNGLEVKAYATHLHKNFPEVYHSQPVQLALSINKARKLHNYAKFFSILRDPETPYLFACIMFKHVEAMRKFALRLMSKAYGGRTVSKQSIEDKYPLPRLVRLLCFEDESEALDACRFYNITVEESQSSTKPAIIYWKRSSFREPTDPEKGFVLTLKPRKMTRIIESKLNGATRLAVCRGEVSGAGASLSSVLPRPAERLESSLSVEPKRQAEQQHQLEEQAAKRRMEERRRMREEQKREEEEKREIEEAERMQKEEAERQALISKKEQEEEMRRKRAEEEERTRKKLVEEERQRKLKVEEAKRAAEAAAREEQLRREAEEKRLAAERAEAMRRAEAERLERLRQEELRKRREEAERLERIRREEEERRRLEETKRRQEEERRRQEQLRLLREREEQERRRREEEARRIAEAKKAKMNQARKLLVWRRLRSKLDRELRRVRTRQSLSRIDPTSPAKLALANLELGAQDVSGERSVDVGINAYADMLPGIYILDYLSRKSCSHINLAAMLRRTLSSQRSCPSLSGATKVILAKVAVVLPAFVGPKAEALQSLVHSWIGRRLQYRRVVIDLPTGGRRPFETRVVASNGAVSTSDFDMALLVIPPFYGDDTQDVYSSAKFPQLDDFVSRAILCLDNGENPAYAQVVNKLLSSVSPDVPFIQVGDVLHSDLFEETLEESCDALLRSFSSATAEESTRRAVVRLSLAQLASKCIQSALWRDGVHPDVDEENNILDRARGTLLAMMMELESLPSTYGKSDQWRRWPPPEFANKRGIVVDYFGQGLNLPLEWKTSWSRPAVEPAVMDMHRQLECSFADVIRNMTIDAPEHMKQECREMMSKRHFRRCFEYVLVWRDSIHVPSIDDCVVYLPKQSVGDIVNGCAQRLALDDDSLLEDSLEQREQEEDEIENSFPTARMRPCRSPAIGTPFRPTGSDFPMDEQVGESPAFSGSQPLANSSRTPDSNILSPPVGVQTPASQPVGVQTPTSPPVNVETPISLPNDCRQRGQSKRGLRDVDDAWQRSKRHRGLSKNQQESLAFTKRLEALLNGETLPDVKVGDRKLSDLLRDAPDIELPT